MKKPVQILMRLLLVVILAAVFSPATAQQAPARLYFTDYTKSFGEATNDGSGIFKFKGVMPDDARYPYYGFTNNASPSSATIVIGTQPYSEYSAALNVEVELGTTYDWAVGHFESINAPHGSFVIRTTDKRYDITLDWNNKTVVFSDYVPEAPEKMWVVNYNTSYGSTSRQAGNIYEFKGIDLKSPYKDYGFADTNSPYSASMILSAVAADKATADNRVKPEMGVAYPIDFSNADMLNAEKGTFDVPAGIYDITLDWDAKTVVFDRPMPATLHVIGYGKSFGTATPDADGVYNFGEVVLNSQFGHYGFATINPANGNIPSWVIEPYPYSVTAPNVEPVSGTAYDWAFSDYDALDFYHGAFRIEDGTYSISLDWPNRKVTFTKAPMKAPNRLWVVNYNTSYGYADKGDDNVFRFEGVTLSSAYRDYGFATGSDPMLADMVISAVDADKAQSYNRVKPEMGVPTPWAFSNWDCLNGERGTFELPSGNYDIELDWDNQTVTFSVAPRKAPDKLYFVSYNYSYREAAKQAGNIYVFEDVKVNCAYPYYGITYTSKPNSADWIIGADLTDFPDEYNVPVELNRAYGINFYEENVMNLERNSFQLGRGTYDVTLDWDAATVTFTQKEQPMPETLWIGRVAKVFASATPENGVFTFKRVKLSNPNSTNPTYGFFNNEAPVDADIVIGARVDNNNQPIVLGEDFPWVYTERYNITNETGGFGAPDGEYDVTLDWNNKTVRFDEPALPPAPATLWVVDDSGNYGSAESVGGVYNFRAVTLNNYTYPYYGFADSPNPRSADVVLSAARAIDASRDNNVEVEIGVEYPLFRSSQQALYDMSGAFVSPIATYDITLDYNNLTVVFNKPHIDTPKTVFASDTYLEDVLGSCASDGSGVFTFNIDVTRSSAIVVFTNSTDLRNGEGQTLYYGSANGPVRTEFDTPYEICPSNYSAVWGDDTGFRLEAGRYRVTLDFNENTATFADISRGDVWTIPETLAMYDDDLALIAEAERVDDGVFLFNNVEIDGRLGSRKVVFTDNPTPEGKFFGSNMTGNPGTDVKNFRTYDLYIPTYNFIAIDGTSCFVVPNGTWTVRVDFNEKNVNFSDTEATYYPEQLDLIAGETVGPRASGNGYYVWKATLAEETRIHFKDPLTGRIYGPSEGDAAVTMGEDIAADELAADATNAFILPAGTYEVIFDLKKCRATFYEYLTISLVDSTMKDGDDFYDYFGAGVDSRMTLTFSGNPYTLSTAFLALGDYVPGMTKSTETCTLENINVYRTGDTFYTDFGKKVRAIPEGAEPKVTLVMTEIRSVHGLLIDTPEIEGLPAGSLMFTFNFREFAPVEVEVKANSGDLEFAKGNVHNLDESEEVTVWLKPIRLVSFADMTLTPVKAVEIPALPEEGDETADAEAQAADGAAAVDYVADGEPVSLDWTVDLDATDDEGFTPVTASIPMSLRGKGLFRLAMSGLTVDDNSTIHGNEVDYIVETLVQPMDIVASDPEAGSAVGELEQVTLTWTHPLIKSVGYFGTANEVAVTDAAGNSYPARLDVASDHSDNQIGVRLETTLKKDGVYTLTIPAGTLIFNDDTAATSNEIAISFTVDETLSGIADILAGDPDRELSVVTTSGILLFKGRAADVLPRLRPGIYIINGLKTYVK